MDLQQLVDAAQTQAPVAGLTHDFYVYPARFSPHFASAAIELFSKPGDLVLDPFMGGGTTIVEALVAGRRAVGSDVNSLAVFLAKVKTTVLKKAEREAVVKWLEETVPSLHYCFPRAQISALLSDARARNLGLCRARAIKKILAIALARLSTLPSEASKNFVRCVLLRTAQWALDNRKRTASLIEFRDRLRANTEAMLEGIEALRKALGSRATPRPRCLLLQADASDLGAHFFFRGRDNQADLVLTSPPYPGVHVLYHRWQVDGRRETPAPYWIADCFDGEGAAFYTFGDRRAAGLTGYFEGLRAAFQSIRAIVKPAGHVVQMVSFKDRRRHLRRYLYAMRVCGFVEVKVDSARRIWREVPNRKWHATFRGKTAASREVVLIHGAT